MIGGDVLVLVVLDMNMDVGTCEFIDPGRDSAYKGFEVYCFRVDRVAVLWRH